MGSKKQRQSCLVAGAGGFIGGYLVKRLLMEGYAVRAVDIKSSEDWWQIHDEAVNWPEHDLRLRGRCFEACSEVRGDDSIDYVYNLAADMGGIGFIEQNRCACMLSVLINTHLLMAAAFRGVKRFLYTSSACVYAETKQNRSDVAALREKDAYPAMPEDGYGWEKLFSERMCRHFQEDQGLEIRIPRLHNVYGPYGSWEDGREKAPAAICRKVAEAKLSGNHEIEVWGDGTKTRSFMWIDDCIEGLRRIMEGEHQEPINLGSSEQVTVNGLVDLVCEIADVDVTKRHDLSKPQGVDGRNSDNHLILSLFNWEPSTSLERGLKQTYRWIEQCIASQK